MDAIIQQSRALHGTVTLSPDKSICHRVVLAAALAHGTTEIVPWPDADDCQRTLEVVQRLGVSVQSFPGRITIQGRGVEGLRAPMQELFCGESGTTLRLAAGVLAGQPFTSKLLASPSLSRRPMQRIAEPLTQMGARLEGTTRSTPQELYPPLTIHGCRPLRAIRYELPVASAQVKSAILLAGLAAEGKTTIVEPIQTRDHTERMLRHYGLRVDRHGDEITLTPGLLRAQGTLQIPGDFSSAAFFVVVASCVPNSCLTLPRVSLNPTRTGLLRVLERMGASIRIDDVQEQWEPRGTLTVESRQLRAITLTAEEVPGVIDELPILMVAAACAQGTSRLYGLGELRVKETDRIQSMVTGLQRLGAPIRLIGGDAVEIAGGALVGHEVDSAGDHRTAMSLAVAGVLAKGQTIIRGAECAAKSFPEFFTLLREVAGSSTVKTVDKV